MDSEAAEYPALRREHVEGARLFADRCDLVSSLSIACNPFIAEVGVAHGEFSEFLVTTLKPAKFFAFDTFEMHRVPVIWGIPSSELFQGMTQLAFYRQRFAHLGDRLVIEEGPSHITLARQSSATFDLIYIDARHDYEGVKGDAELSAPLLKPGGYLVFNDYTMYDYLQGGRYGVVPAVNEMVVRGGWKVVGFGLQRHMFCDIALRKES